MDLEKLKKQSFDKKTSESVEETSIEKLEETLELLKGKVKKLAKKNGFSKKLKKRVALELL